MCFIWNFIQRRNKGRIMRRMKGRHKRRKSPKNRRSASRGKMRRTNLESQEIEIIRRKEMSRYQQYGIGWGAKCFWGPSEGGKGLAREAQQQ